MLSLPNFQGMFQKLSVWMYPLYHQSLELKCGVKPGTNGSYYIQISMLLCNLDEFINIYHTLRFFFIVFLIPGLGHKVVAASATDAFCVVSIGVCLQPFQYRICFSSRCTSSQKQGRWHRLCTARSRNVPPSRWCTQRMAPHTPRWTPQSTRWFTSIPWKLRRHVWFWAHPLPYGI